MRVKLTTAMNNKNDEFYTTEEHALDFVSNIEDDLNFKKVLLPCDTKESEIYKAVVRRWPNAAITLSDVSKICFLEIEFDDYDYVMTNPPFSLWKHLAAKLIKDQEEGKTYKWLFMGTNLVIMKKYFAPLWDKTYWSKSKNILKWKNIVKEVPIRDYSNFVNFKRDKLIFNTGDSKVLVDDEGRKFINKIKEIEPIDGIWVPIGIFNKDFEKYFEPTDIGGLMYKGKHTFVRIKLKLKGDINVEIN